MSLAEKDVIGLSLWAHPLEDEPAHGLFLRLAEVNGYHSSREVAKCVGFSLASVRRGSNIDKLAKAIHCDEAKLLANSFHFSVGKKVSIRGELVNLRRDLMGTVRRACPRCVAESAHHRFWWDLNFIDCCPRHKLHLVDRCWCVERSRLSWHDGKIASCRRCMGQGVASANTGRAVGNEMPAPDYHLKANSYLLGRLGVCEKETVPVLDALPLDEVVDVLDRIGAFELGGYSKKWQTAATLGKKPSEVRAWGYSMLSSGFMPSIMNGMYEEYLRANPHDPNPSRSRTLGWFYHWLNWKGGKNFSPGIARFMEEAPWNYYGSIGHKFRKSDVEFRSYYMTLEEAAKECEQGKTTLRRILKQFGKDRALTRQGIPFRIERDFVTILKNVLGEECNFAEVRRILGAGHLTVQRFIESGFFAPVVVGGGDRHEYAFRRADVDAFLELLGKGARQLDVCPDNALPLQKAARIYAAPLDKLCMSIVLGDSKLAGRIHRDNGLDQFVISREETRNFRRRYIEAGEDFLLEGIFQFRRMKQLELDLKENPATNAA
jgi:hypothetical protein